LKVDEPKSENQNNSIGSKVGTAIAVVFYPIYTIPSILGWIWDEIFQNWILALALLC
jgi:hypothetical protein